MTIFRKKGRGYGVRLMSVAVNDMVPNFVVFIVQLGRSHCEAFLEMLRFQESLEQAVGSGVMTGKPPLARAGGPCVFSEFPDRALFSPFPLTILSFSLGGLEALSRWLRNAEH